MGKAGRKSLEFTEKDKKLVRQLAGLGLTHQEISTVMKCDRKSLEKHFDEELKLGKTEAKELVVNQLFHNIKRGCVTSIIFWLKTQGGYSETMNINQNIKLSELGIRTRSMPDDDNG